MACLEGIKQLVGKGEGAETQQGLSEYVLYHCFILAFPVESINLIRELVRFLCVGAPNHSFLLMLLFPILKQINQTSLHVHMPCLVRMESVKEGVRMSLQLAGLRVVNKKKRDFHFNQGHGCFI